VSFVDISKSDNKYQVIYTDPPWPQRKGGIRKARPNQKRELDYSTMSLDDISSFHKSILSKNTAETHNVFMWTIDKYLYEAERMMNRLGYKLHARIIWDKTNGIAPAFTIRFTHEYLLWFYISGRILMPVKKHRGKYTTVIRESSTIHSRKPVAAYQMIEDMFDGKKIELFAREKRNGWDCYGDEPNLQEE